VQDENRNKRLRLLVKKLNKERKKQGKQIDILCNDLISAQRDFMKRLKAVSFVANFYESIIGATDLNHLLYTTVELIKEQIDGANVTFFIFRTETFEQHSFESGHADAFEKEHFVNCFSPELIENICAANKVCTLEDMFAMGLHGNLVELSKISAVTIPLDSFCSQSGFMLVYRSSERKLTSDEIGSISAITNGLSRAVVSCQGLLHMND
jgi:transcriptional regulator with GAF, ATPase, and Fis domain